PGPGPAAIVASGRVTIDVATRRHVRRRARDLCEYYRLPQAAAPFLTFHVEHIVAEQHGGDDSGENLALACPDCNRHKGPNLTSIDPVSLQTVALFHPRQQSWAEHFRADGVLIHGLTEPGRTTARLLRFNDPERLAMRAALLTLGEWPASFE